MKDEQQPRALEVLEAVQPSIDVRQREWNGATPYLGTREVLQEITRTA
jgi:hypothetical protein